MRDKGNGTFKESPSKAGDLKRNKGEINIEGNITFSSDSVRIVKKHFIIILKNAHSIKDICKNGKEPLVMIVMENVKMGRIVTKTESLSLYTNSIRHRISGLPDNERRERDRLHKISRGWTSGS